MKTKNKSSNVLMLIGVLCLFALLSTKNAQACSCIMPQEPQEELERSSFVFLGEATDVHENSYGYDVTFTTLETWKGIFTKEVMLHTGQGGGDCGFPFEEGKQYIVYGYTDESGEKYAGICSRTALIDDAEEDLIELGEGSSVSVKENTTYPTPVVSETKDNTAAFVLGGFLLLLLFILIFVP